MKITVIGDLMLDHYFWGETKRISPEAPVPIVNIKKESSFLGGAGNVVRNLIALKSEVNILSVIGNDNVGFKIKDELEKLDVNTNMIIIENERLSSQKNRIIASKQQVIRYDKETKKDILNISQELLIENFKKIIYNTSIIIISDYGKGVITKTLAQKIIEISKQANKKVIIDPKGKDYTKYKGAYCITPNKEEAIEATNIHIKNRKDLKKALKVLKEDYNLNYSMITLSEEGISFFDNELEIFPTVAREVFDVTGAGDTVISSLAYALGNNENIENAIKFANLSAGIVVGKIGSATASLDEIEEYKSSLHKSKSINHIKTKEEIAEISKKIKSKDKKIVFTNGCFDILHRGHISYLEEAKSYGDFLIVGVNSDNSVKKLKGDSRPINEEIDRAYILAALEAVDFVVIFEEDTPYELIKLITPDILVKGGDYKEKSVVGSDIVKKLILVDFVNGKSSTKIIEKIQSQC